MAEFPVEPMMSKMLIASEKYVKAVISLFLFFLFQRWYNQRGRRRKGRGRDEALPSRSALANPLLSSLFGGYHAG